nr:MAG TPA: hypothetical protein [Caudoviricetes sp.]
MHIGRKHKPTARSGVHGVALHNSCLFYIGFNFII